MCTAISWPQKDHYFGRTLDLEQSFGEQVVITPRYYPLKFCHLPTQEKHYAIIGMAVEAQGTPLYFDAVNEMGLCVAALNFPGLCRYQAYQPHCTSVASYEVIPWLLGQCAGLEQAAALLQDCVITDEAFSTEYAPTSLHWLVADEHENLVVESTAKGVQIYHGCGVLTNAPEYPKQLSYAAEFAALSPKCPSNQRGTGSIGLPGDFTSRGRFVRADFLKKYCICDGSEGDAVEQFFHMMELVTQPRGCVKTDGCALVQTQYTSCCNTDKGIYYYTTSTNRRICGVDLHGVDLKGSQLLCYPLHKRPDFRMEAQSRLTESSK